MIDAVQVKPPDAAVIAPLPRRAVAYVVDVGVLAPVLLLGLLVHGRAVPALVVLAAGVQIVNQVVFVTRTGRTIGKRLTGLRIVDFTNHGNPSGVQAFVRWFVVSVGIGIAWRPAWLGGGWSILIGPWQVVCYGLILLDRTTRRGLHDRVAGTLVVDARVADTPLPR